MQEQEQEQEVQVYDQEPEQDVMLSQLQQLFDSAADDKRQHVVRGLQWQGESSQDTDGQGQG